MLSMGLGLVDEGPGLVYGFYGELWFYALDGFSVEWRGVPPGRVRIFVVVAGYRAYVVLC